MLGKGIIIGTPNIAVFYNYGQEYFRRKLANEGDFCEWFNFSPSLLREVIGLYDPTVAERGKRPFIHTHAPLGTYWHLLQRNIIEHLLHVPSPDAFWVNEMALILLGGIIHDSFQVRGFAPQKRKRSTKRQHNMLAIEAQKLLQKNLRQPITLAQLAKALYTSPFHLARIFRQQTGYTIHRYLENLRLRTALEQLPIYKNDLTTLALESGYKSHSHFTHAFHRAFGLPPSIMNYKQALEMASV